MDPEKIKEEQDKENLWCEYSDLPSPLAYSECADYDSMGNHGRFPAKSESKKESIIANLFSKKK